MWQHKVLFAAIVVEVSLGFEILDKPFSGSASDPPGYGQQPIMWRSKRDAWYAKSTGNPVYEIGSLRAMSDDDYKKWVLMDKHLNLAALGPVPSNISEPFALIYNGTILGFYSTEFNAFGANEGDIIDESEIPYSVSVYPWNFSGNLPDIVDPFDSNMIFGWPVTSRSPL